MNQIKLLTTTFCLGITLSCLTSCNNQSKRDINAIKALAENHVQELEISQLLEEFILSLDNDTTGVCYTLVMPKQSLLRLMKKRLMQLPVEYKRLEKLL